MKPIIELIDVTKIFKIPNVKTESLKNYIIHFNKNRKSDLLYALRNINLKIYPGEFVGIIGKNGSGKSTLLKLIAKILFPTYGTINVLGEISPFLELGVGFNYELSAKENIYLYSSILGISKKNVHRKLHEIIKLSELEDFIESPLKTYSSGMHVRLAFAVAIQSEAPIILVDEVLAVGDIAFQKKCFSIFDNFKNNGKTILFVSHDLDTVGKYCDKVYYLKRGEEIYCGTADQMIPMYKHDAQ